MKKMFAFLKGMFNFAAIFRAPVMAMLGVTTDLTAGAKAYTAPIAGFNKRFQVRSNLITIPAGAATNDIIKVVPIKKGWLIHGTREEIVVAGVGSAVTLDVGITSGTVDGFDAAIDGKSAAGTILKSTPSDTYPAAGGFLAAADGTVDIKCKTITAMTTPTQLYVILDVEDLNH